MNLLKTKLFLTLTKEIRKHNNCLLIKHSKNKKYLRNDIDFLSNDVELIKGLFSKKIFFRINISNKENGYHIDFFKFNIFILRIDISSSLKDNEIFRFKKSYYIDIFENKIDAKSSDDLFMKNFFIPKLEFELLIRLSEYVNSPDKVHHKEYLKNNFSVLSSIEYNKYLDIYNQEKFDQFIGNI